MYIRTYNDLRPSSSTIVTMSIQSGCTKTLLGKEDESMVTLNDSFFSKIVSSNTEMETGFV